MPKFSIGDSVQILDKKKYGGKYELDFGVVDVIFRKKTDSSVLIGVKIENIVNPRSVRGCFWFCPTQLAHAGLIDNNSTENEREEIRMFNNFRVAEVVFTNTEGNNDSKARYAYALYDNDIQVEDKVVVATAHHGFAIAEVVSIYDDAENRKEVKFGREVVCKADFSKYYFRRDAEKKSAQLKRDMEKRIREAQELALYEALAEKDPTLKGMLEEYKNLMECCK